MSFAVRFTVNGVPYPYLTFVHARNKKAAQEKIARWIVGDIVCVEVRAGVLTRLSASLIESFEVTEYVVFATASAWHGDGGKG